jgi:hypothetical protein|tara:strand:- start:1123 stop:1746 length:624 start_codon:yes stop_codon:yes gene_type:complete
MPIFYHKKTHKRFFFIHIPRTAGRFLLENFRENGYNIEHHLTKKILEEKDVNDYLCECQDKIENGHAHYSHYNKWKNINGLSSIAVVRNPVDKFFSSSFPLAKKYDQSYLESWINFERVFLIQTKYKSSWWLPQHEFISPHTKIWKYENGFGNNFCDWISNIISIPFSIKIKTYTKSNYDELIFKKSKALINNIKKFYYQDFQLFNY